MAAKSMGIVAERDELVKEQLSAIKESLAEMKASLAQVSANLDSVRIAELASIRATANDLQANLTGKIAVHDAELKLLRYQMGRTAAAWSLITGSVSSAIVAAVMALVLRH